MSYVERIVPGEAYWSSYVPAHRQRYQFATGFIRGGRVLDAGCGVGYGARMLAEAGATEVVAVDISDAALDQASRYFAHPRVRLVRDNCETMTMVDGFFNAIVAFESLEHFQEPRVFLEKVASLLTPGGVFLCSTPNAMVFPPSSDGRPKNPYHVHEYTPEEFHALLGSHFGEVSVRGQHLTAAYRFAGQLALLWSNPFIRFGLLLQRLRGHKVRWKAPSVDCTEADYVIREDELSSAEVLVGICRRSLRATREAYGSLTEAPMTDSGRF